MSEGSLDGEPPNGCNPSVLGLLRHAATLAADASCNRWEFAVELPELLRAGASVTTLRWLVAKGLALHGTETRGEGDPRAITPTHSLRFGKRSCFVLADVSIDGTRLTLATQIIEGKPPPHWDAERRELWFRGTLVKRFRVPADNQERILAAFEEEGWPGRVDDPLPPHGEVEPKRRLRATVQALNRAQATPRVRFESDGQGTGVCWQIFDECCA